MLLCIGLLELGLPSYDEAAEWSVLPSIGVKGIYNSNLTMTPLPHDETYGVWTSPAADFSGKTERLEVSGKIAADFVSYYGGEETQFTNIFFPMAIRYKTESAAFGLSGGFTRDNTLLSELLATGVVLRFTQRNQVNANPSWSRTLTEKLSFQSSAQFSNTTYENGQKLNLVDYRLIGGTTGLLYQITERDNIQLSGSYVTFQTINTPSSFQASFPGANITFSHALSESITAVAYGGPRFVGSTTETGNGATKSHNTVWLFGASLTKQFENAKLEISGSRNIIPSGFGLLIQTDRLSLLASRDLSETLTISFDASGYQVEGVTTRALGGTSPKQTYYYVSPRIEWKFSEWWKLGVSYTHGQRDAVGTVSSNSNATTITISYYPPKLAISN
jgi:hypothetical protein